MAKLPQKKFVVSNLRLTEISSVDRPAQAGAVAVLTKRAGDPSDVDIRKSAAAVADGDVPSYPVSDYEDAMFRRANELAQHHRVTPEQALVQGLAQDTTLKDLAHATEVARYNAFATEVRKRDARRG